MHEKICQELRFRPTHLAVTAGQIAFFEVDATPDSGKVVALNGDGLLARQGEFDQSIVGPAELSVYSGTSVRAWAKGAVVRRGDSYRVVINADQVFGPAFPTILTAIVHKPADWEFVLSLAQDADITASDFEAVEIVSAAACWKSTGPLR